MSRGKIIFHGGKSANFQAYNEHVSSPFRVNGVGERWIQKERSMAPVEFVDKGTGEVVPLFFAPLNMRVPHDAAIYTKVFCNDLSGWGVGAKLIFLYVVMHIRPLGREIELNWKTVSAWAGISKNVYYKGLKELLDGDVLAFKSKGRQLFFVNPNFVYNGNRTKMKAG